MKKNAPRVLPVAHSHNVEGDDMAIRGTRSRWIILAVAGMVIFVAYLMQYQASALAFRIGPSFGIDSVELANLMFAPMLLAAFIGIPLGVLADKFGVRRVVGLALVVSCCAAFARVEAQSYTPLLIFTVLLGFAPAAMNANIMRLFGAWFEDKVSVAIGVYYACSGLGAMAALYTSAVLPSTRTAFLVSAVALLVCVALWWLLVANAPECAQTHDEARDAAPSDSLTDGEMSAIACFLKAAKSKGMWLVAFATSVGLAAKTAYLSFMPQALAQSMPPAMANGLAMAVTLGGIAGCLFGPMLCMRSGHPKRLLVLCSAATSLLMCFTAVTLSTPSAAVLFAVGALSSMTAPLVEAVPCRLPELRGVVGSAGGIIGSASLVATYAIPLIIVSLVGSNYTIQMIAVAVCFALSIPAILRLPSLN